MKWRRRRQRAVAFEPRENRAEASRHIGTAHRKSAGDRAFDRPPEVRRTIYRIAVSILPNFACAIARRKQWAAIEFPDCSWRDRFGARAMRSRTSGFGGGLLTTTGNSLEDSGRTTACASMRKRTCMPEPPYVRMFSRPASYFRRPAGAARSGNSSAIPSRDASQIPASVMRPVTRRAGVTSNA